MVAHACNASTWQVDPCSFKTSLTSRASSSQPRSRVCLKKKKNLFHYLRLFCFVQVLFCLRQGLSMYPWLPPNYTEQTGFWFTANPCTSVPPNAEIYSHAQSSWWYFFSFLLTCECFFKWLSRKPRKLTQQARCQRCKREDLEDLSLNAQHPHKDPETAGS